MKSNRRQILQGLGLGTVWTAPIISSVTLPTHAATTIIITCSGQATALFDDDGGDADRVQVIFNGRSCTTRAVDGEPPEVDEVALIDAGIVNGVNWDLERAGGGNWNVSGFTGQAEDNPAGSYSLIATGVGGQQNGLTFRMDFTVSFDVTPGIQNVMTVNITFTRI